MSIAIEIDSRKLLKNIKTLPRKDKIYLADSIEKDLLSEFDKIEESEEVKNRVNEALKAYDAGDFVNLKDLMNAI